MLRILYGVLFICVWHYASGLSHLQHDICGDNTTRSARSCTTQILGDPNADLSQCHIEYYSPNSPKCLDMNFGPITSNIHVGRVNLKPYILSVEQQGNTSSLNRAVLNITFSNIKWKTMKFRFKTAKQKKNLENHCRDIILSNNITINDQSILYYDCYWPIMTDTDGSFPGQSHILDFEAMTDDKVVNRGQYYFNVPSAKMLSETVSESEWLPFLYIEILTETMKLHIMPPPGQLNITAYEINIMKEGNKGTHVEKTSRVPLKNHTHEVTYEHSLLNNGTYYFMVTPIHDKCKNTSEEGCQTVESPKIMISSEIQSLNICIASITALIVATLFAYYIALRVIRRYWCKDYRLAMGNEVPPPTKVLVVYSNANRLHAECVTSFVNYLRSEYGFDIMFDGDISSTSHGDPFIWAEEAFRLSSHIMYIVGPTEESNLYNNIYDKPIITPHKDVDTLLLSLVKLNRVSKCRKEVFNVFFEYSNGQIPVETRHDRVFFLLKDWQKLIAYLSKNLLPKKQIMRTEKGRCLLEDLTRAKKLLSGHHDDVVIKCEKLSFSDKKVLI